MRKRSKHELKRILETSAESLWRLGERGLWLGVDELETTGRPPSVIRAWATLHFLQTGSPFCCGEPGCYNDTTREGCRALAESVARAMGMRQVADLSLCMGAAHHHGRPVPLYG